MKATAAQIRGLLDSPKPDTRLYLFHGPDEAGARDLIDRLTRAMGPDIERVDLDARQLRESPGRLADEAASLSLFGGKRLIRITTAEDSMLEPFSLLLGASQAGNPVVAIGPGLKGTGKLVKLALAAPNAIAFACYVPEGREASQLAASMAREHGLRLTGDTAQRLATASAGDRAILSREIEKLALYLDAAPERPRDADGAALDAIGADLGDAELFRAIEAVIDGRAADIGAELARLDEAGTSAIPLLRQLVRRLMTIAELRAEIDAGARADAVLERVFFRERAATGRALRRWTAPQLARAIERVRETERALMAPANPGEIIAEAECAAIARAAARF